MSATGNTLGIRREDKNKWERRVPLAPKHVAELCKKGINVIVQSSQRRVFSDEEYVEAGACIQEDLSSCNVILGVKTVPANLILPERSYMFFSHTIKAQPENMPMLDNICLKNVRLFDYECIVDPSTGRRLVAFGEFAGMAGLIDFFRGLGERLLALGYSTPFLHVASAYMYKDLNAATDALRELGKAIQEHGLPKQICPMTFVFTGTGRVSQGALKIFQLFPHKMISPTELEHVATAKDVDCHVLYGVVATAEHMVVRRDKPAAPFDKAHYYDHPELYRPVFHDKIVPYTSVLVNCMYWDHRFPRLLTVAQAKRLHVSGHMRLIGLCDISCDLEGGVEFVTQYTSIERPFLLYDIDTGDFHDSLDGEGVLYHAVDHLPSELPREASFRFGELLLRFVEALVKCDPSRPVLEQNEVPMELRNACITDRGRLTPNFTYIAQMRAVEDRVRALRRPSADSVDRPFALVTVKGHLFDQGLINMLLDVVEREGAGFDILDWELGQSNQHMSTAVIKVHSRSEKQLVALLQKLDHLRLPPDATIRSSYRPIDEQVAKESLKLGVSQRVLLLGAGMVASPVVEFLLRAPSNHVTVASQLLKDARALTAKRKRTSAVELDVMNAAALDELVDQSDVVISFIPAPLHPIVADSCIRCGKNLVTASYVSPQMRALHTRAQEAGIIILCEMGLDPGIDHMSAMKVITDVHAKGGSITGFVSVCGGLPAPEAADNPLAYKFSWSPRAVLTAGKQPATFKIDGKVEEVSGEELFSSAKEMQINPALALEHIPNRNSLPYADMYGIPDVQTMYRGTLRYKGFCSIMNAFAHLGLFDESQDPLLGPDAPNLTWSQLTRSLLGLDEAGDVQSALLQKMRLAGDQNAPAARRVLDALDWLGMLSEHAVVKKGTLLDTVCALLQERLAYHEGERDMVLLHHHFTIRWPSAVTEERTSTLLAYGEPHGRTAMSLTVAYPAAIAAQLILDGRIHGKGIVTPVVPEIFNPVLQMLEKEGIRFVEKHL